MWWLGSFWGRNHESLCDKSAGSWWQFVPSIAKNRARECLKPVTFENSRRNFGKKSCFFYEKLLSHGRVTIAQFCAPCQNEFQLEWIILQPTRQPCSRSKARCCGIFKATNEVSDEKKSRLRKRETERGANLNIHRPSRKTRGSAKAWLHIDYHGKSKEKKGGIFFCSVGKIVMAWTSTFLPVRKVNTVPKRRPRPVSHFHKC